MSRNLTAAEAAARLEDARWMAETGECLDGAARRLGISKAALERWLTANDRATLSALLAKQPRDHNNRVAGEISVYELTGLRGRRNRQRRKAERYVTREAGAA
jgi:hypothetical protein